jgi:hypothetical protein
MSRKGTNVTGLNGPLRVGIGGPVGSGKTALMDALCKAMRDTYDIAAVTNDITPSGTPSSWCARARFAPTASSASNRRLPPCRDSRGCVDEPRRGRGRALFACEPAEAGCEC